MTRQEIRDNVKDRTRETGSAMDAIINDFIDNTIDEIQNPGWSFPAVRQRAHDHLWNFNKRKTTLTTEENVVDYELPRDLQKLAFARQTDTPTILRQVPDDRFYESIPDPTTTGNPRFYRLWEETGLGTELAEADTIDVISDNANDGSSFTVSVVGYVGGIKDSEVLTLNGTTIVRGDKTFDADRPMRISKSGATTGTITVTENSGGTTILTLGPEERGARFKIISFYPIPSSEITIYLQYFTRLRHLANDSDEADFDEAWHWVIEQGALAKTFEYKQAETMHRQAQKMYADGVRSMIQADLTDYDYIPRLRSTALDRIAVGPIRLGDNQADDGKFGIWF